MTLSKEQIYEDVITKLIACLKKTNRKTIEKITIGYMDRLKNKIHKR